MEEEGGIPTGFQKSPAGCRGGGYSRLQEQHAHSLEAWAGVRCWRRSRGLDEGGRGPIAEHLKHQAQDPGLSPLALGAMGGFKAGE